MELTEEHKNKVGKQLVLATAKALKDGHLTAEQLPDVSSFIMARIDTCKTQADFVEFLRDLYLKWPFFSHIFTIEKGVIEEAQEDVKIEEMEKLIKEKKIDEAIETAKDENAEEHTGGAN